MNPDGYTTVERRTPPKKAKSKANGARKQSGQVLPAAKPANVTVNKSANKAANQPLNKKMASKSIPKSILKLTPASSKAPAAMVPIQQPVLSFDAFKQLPQQDRKALLAGPTVAICVRGHKLAELPKRLVMAVSPFANARFTVDQMATILILHPNSTKDAVIYIAKYLVNVCNTVNVFRLPWKDVTKTAAIYQVGRTLQLGKFFKHLENYLVDQIHDDAGIMGYDELEVVLNRTNNDVTDPVFKRYANALATLRFKGEIPDSDQFDTWVSARPELASLMQEIDEKYQAKREKSQAANDARLARQERVNRRPGVARFRAQGGKPHRLNDPEIAASSFSGVHTLPADKARKLGKKGLSA